MLLILIFLTSCSKTDEVLSGNNEIEDILLEEEIVVQDIYYGLGADKGYFFELYSGNRLVIYIMRDWGGENKKEKIAEYQCEKECFISSTEENVAIFEQGNKMIFIMDGEYYLFSVREEKILAGPYTQMYNLAKDSYDYFSTTQALIVSKDGKEGIIDLEGNELLSPSYNSLGKTNIGNKFGYSYTNDYIVAKDTGGWGVLRLSDFNSIVPFQYQDILFVTDKYFVIEDSEGYRLLRMGTQEDVLQKSFEYINVIDSYIIKVENGLLDILDLEGNSVLEEEIQTYLPYEPYACCAIASGIFVDQKENSIYIFIDKRIGEYDYETFRYQFDMETKELQEVEYIPDYQR